jgi:hypothetical protein
MDLFLYCDLDQTELHLGGSVSEHDASALDRVLARIEQSVPVTIDVSDLAADSDHEVVTRCAAERALHATGPVAIVSARSIRHAMGPA